MGKASLLLVLAVIMAGTVTMVSRDRIAVDTANQEALYEGQTLARVYAESGINLAFTRTVNDFSGYRPAGEFVDYKEGGYEITVTGPTAGPADITVVGHYGPFRYTISGTVGQQGVRAIDALTVAGPLKKWEIKNTAFISGYDTDTDGSNGSGVDVHAIYAADASAYTYMSTRFTAGDAIGVGGNPDYTTTAPDVSFSDYVQEIFSYDGDALTEYNKNQTWKNLTFGSPESPVMLHVDGDVKLQDNTVGYGVLFVDGGLTMEKNSRWEGLIYALDNGGKRTFQDASSVYGAVIMQSADDAGGTGVDAGPLGGHFDVDVFSTATAAEVYHQHMYDDKYMTDTVDLLDPGCKKGKLCWSTIMAGKTSIYLEFDNVSSSWGTYTITAAANATLGTPSVNATGYTNDGGFTSQLLDAGSLSALRVQFHALCSMEPTKPSSVQGDASDRDGAFRIRAYAASKPGASWVKGAMLYEIAMYHHDDTATQCAPGTEDVAGAPAVGKQMELTMENTASIRYSSEALSRLSELIPSLNVATGSYRLTGVRESVTIVE